MTILNGLRDRGVGGARSSRLETRPGIRRAIPLLLLSTTGLAAFSGCTATGRHDHDRDQRGVVYYFDGAGGGSLLTDWGHGVRAGLERAEFDGEFRSVNWQTGLGVADDQSADLDYRRSKARESANQIAEFQRMHPDTPITFIGLAEGSAQAVLTLEATPESVQIRDVIMLGASLAQDYDLTAALRRVHGRMYVFTSSRDPLLEISPPSLGPTRRAFSGAASAGLHGFHLPRGDASRETLRQYSKVENIEWRPEFARRASFGGRTNVITPHFVEAYIAPKVQRLGPNYSYAAQAPDPHPHRDLQRTRNPK